MASLQRLPLSIRQNADAISEYTGPFDGIPAWMAPGVRAWIRRFFIKDSFYKIWDEAELRRAAAYCRSSLDWASGRVEDILLGWLRDDERALDLLDYCVGRLVNSAAKNGLVAELQDLLSVSGSAWKVGRDIDDRYCLQRRVNDTVERAAQDEIAQPGRAAEYLRSSWNYVYGRTPDPNAAYGDAIRAIEAAGWPIVSPKNQRATLGTMIRDVKAKPEKWTTVIGHVDTVLKMMQAIWDSHSGRHGTDSNTKPANVSQEQAEAAVHLAVTLVQLFRTQGIRLSSTSL